MSVKLEIELGKLSEFGDKLSGEIHSDVFELNESEGVTKSGLIYDFHAQRFDEELLLQGSIKTVFELECVRTLHPFIKTIEVKGLALAIKIEEEVVDVTEQLREEIMLLLPVYPVCEMGDEKMSCEVEEKYLALDKDQNLDLEQKPAENQDDRWAALDNLGNL